MVVHVNNSLSGCCFFLASRLTIVSLDFILYHVASGRDINFLLHGYLLFGLVLGRKETWLRKATNTIWSHFVTIYYARLSLVLYIAFPCDFRFTSTINFIKMKR